ncbi:Potassium channel domain-containing protein [Caenorhabditis elegans]|uniref:Potassium channel domain-containing protein n=2 Tax=Caenorhabditis elegans TaxID=6239 RepID=I2HAD3_CAEEL|nr:Potassium channel domain-containing protein [Caenorhabditis elegans]CCH63840.1 Potassium channel domain-containing protein [Caenorhabditis elegans]|eukprot:NP_001257229.1 TWiK family of potassium channels [Caenorhabditis elegans]
MFSLRRKIPHKTSVANSTITRTSTVSNSKCAWMKFRNVLRIALGHLALYCFVVCYVFAGAWVFHQLEGENETELHDKQREYAMNLKKDVIAKLATTENVAEINEHLRMFLRNISNLHISLDNYLIFNEPTQIVPKRWTFPSSVLFSFTILTTIGYGNVTPHTQQCKVFLMIYGAFGIPLFLITIADLGRFSKTAIMALVQKVSKRELKKQSDEHLLREIAEVLLVAGLFVVFIAIGSAVIPLWENQLTYFDSVYFSYMSLTTIGLGDIVPRRMDFLLPTLIYITIGLWLTTALVEQLADVFRLVHYAGRQVTNVKGITVWLGGRRLSMGGLISTVCRRVGMSDNLINQINWDRTVIDALDGKMPPTLPIFPWHFTDFLEHDPPLIDLSIDLDQMDGSFYCSKPLSAKKQRRASQMSAPAISWMRPQEEARILDADGTFPNIDA